MIRRKRKPDAYHLNIVREGGGSSKRPRDVRIERVTIPFSQMGDNAGNSRDVENDLLTSELNVSRSILGRDFEGNAVDASFNAEGDTAESTNGKLTAHQKRKLQAAKAWESSRASIFRCAVEYSTLPKVFCQHCNKVNSSVCCKQCGPRVYYCVECAVKLHTTMYVLHSPQLWKDDLHMYVPLPLHKMLCLPHHSCDTQYERNVTCVDEFGVQHNITFTFCQCFGEAETLIHFELFPATPKRPTVAFSFQLLDYLEALLLECQVAVSDFTAAMKILSASPFIKDVKSLYPLLIDPFEEYRFLKNQLRTMRTVCPDCSDGTTCPACPQDGGTLIVSIDALFGLCRKKCAGTSVRAPLQQGIFFECQSDVDAFVAEYPSSSSSESQECNQFLATHALRSKSRFKALDETGVMGLACRHEFPYRFYNLRHGERISYVVYALKLLKERSATQEKVMLLYDVACLLKRHLQTAKRQDLLEFFELAVPVFHAYGHKMDCQLCNSPRYKPGFGCTDGEVLERLWSYLRRFSRMTKEMRPSHRIDVLTDALLYCGRQAASNLKKLLPKRLHRAQNLGGEAKKKFEELMTNSPVSFDEADVIHWLEVEQQASAQVVADSTSSLAKLGVSSRERWYLLTLKAKYADGQYMASRLSKAITKETSRLKLLLAEYNSDVTPSEQLTWEDVCHPSAQVWSQLEQPLDLPVPKPVRIAAINALMTKRRAEEEVVMLQQEMRTVMAYYVKDVGALTSAIEILEASAMTAYDRGCVSLLKVRLSKVKHELLSCCSSYKQFVDVPDLTRLNLDLHVPPLDIMDFAQEPQEVVVNSMGVDDLEEELLPSPLFYPRLSAGCLEHECYLSDSEESMDSTREECDPLLFTSTSSISADSKAVTVLENDDPEVKESNEQGAWESETNTWDKKENVWMEKWDDETAVRQKEVDLCEQEADVQKEEAGLWEEKTDAWAKETNFQEQDADMWKESKGYVPNDELEDENEEEERYIRVLHNRLKREEFLKTNHSEQLPDMLEPDDQALLIQLDMQAERHRQQHKVDGLLPPKRRHLYLNWKKERLQRAVELSKKDLQLAKIRTVGPYFKH